MTLILSILKLILSIIIIYLFNSKTIDTVDNSKKYFNKNIAIKNKVIISILIKILIVTLVFYMTSIFVYSYSLSENLVGEFGKMVIVFLLIIFKVHDVIYSKKLKKQIS